MVFYSKIYRIYVHKILPRIKDFRGATRASFFLLKRALKKSGVSNQVLRVSGYDLELSETKHFVSIVDEQKFYNIYLEAVKDAAVVADLGACKGFYSCLSAISADKVYGFEFDPENLKDFKANRALNGFENIEVIEKAVSDSKGFIAAEFDKNGTNTIGKGENEVEKVSLDTFFQERKDPDLIKIDVEGAELKVLKGASKLIERKRPEIFLELHKGQRIESFSHRPEEVVKFLEERGYRVQNLSERNESEMIRATHEE